MLFNCRLFRLRTIFAIKSLLHIILIINSRTLIKNTTPTHRERAGRQQMQSYDECECNCVPHYLEFAKSDKRLFHGKNTLLISRIS